MRIYLPDITDRVKTMEAEPLYYGETFNNAAVLERYALTLEYYRAGETVCLDVVGGFEVTAACDRCSAPVAVSVEMREQFVLFPAAGNPDMDYVYEDDVIELDPYIHEAIVLNIPAKILCDDSCKGLCPQCGGNLNDASCRCGKQT